MEQTYAQKFALLAPFHNEIFTAVRKALREEHLKQNRGFFKRHFAGLEINKVTVDDLLRVYPQLIAKGDESVGEFIANRWLLRHLEVYNFFENRLKAYDENFENIQELEKTFAKSLLTDAVAAFGAKNSYIFAILNSVALPAQLLKELHAAAAT